MNKRFAVSLIAASLTTSGAAFAQSTTVEGAETGGRVGGDVDGPGGAGVGGTGRGAVGFGLESPTAVLAGLPRDRSAVVRDRVVVGEPLPEVVELRPVP